MKNICSSSGGAQALRKKERQGETQFTTKIGGKTSLGPVLALRKIFILSYMPDAILWENWPFSPPNRVTIWINCNRY